MKTRQTLDQLRAEVEFRAKLARQHVSGEPVLPDYYQKDEHDEILRARVDTTRETMARLAARGIGLSPFLELGAERGQRSLVLVNEFAATGVAADISYHQLRTMEHFAELFGLERLPLRVCCDVNQLPFRNAAFRFVFCYQFLHHFPSLDPVIREIYRVLAAGSFYFDEEPYRRVLRLALYSRAPATESPNDWRSNRYIRLIDSFLAHEATAEDDHGVLENHDIPLRSWAAALAIFDRHEIALSSIYGVRSTLGARVGSRNLLNWLLGGLVGGVCQKDDADGVQPVDEIEAALACPECLHRPDDVDSPGLLISATDEFRCASCATAYPRRDGVLFLLPQLLREQLYPDL